MTGIASSTPHRRINLTGHSLRRSHASKAPKDRPPNAKNLSAGEAPGPGRQHVGIAGDIIAECPVDFIGIDSSVFKARNSLRNQGF